MAVRKSYKIPANVDVNYLDMEIAMKTKQGIGLKPLPVRMLLIWVVAILLTMYIISNESSPIAYTSIGIKILFVLTCGAFTYTMTKLTPTHLMHIELVPAMMNYMMKSNRQVLTRRSENASPFYVIAGIDDIDTETGVVKYIDGTYGYWYAVVGSASILLFPDDRDAILEAVDSFYKKLQTDCEIIFVTVKEPQKIARQAAHIMEQYDKLEYRDPDMDMITKEQFNVLTKFVGSEFKSIHQYMILKGDNREALSVINNIVISEARQSNLVFKECEALYEADIERVLRSIYSGD